MADNVFSVDGYVLKDKQEPAEVKWELVKFKVDTDILILLSYKDVCR